MRAPRQKDPPPRTALIGAAALALVATGVAPAVADDHENLPGDPTLTLPINDSAAGGTYDQDFTRAYAGTTPDGTPVYIATLVSNSPTGQLSFLDAGYTLGVKNTGNGKKK